MKMYLMFILLILGFILGITSYGESGLRIDQEQTIAVSGGDPPQFLMDYGETICGQTVQKSFYIKNNTGKGIELFGRVACNCALLEADQPALKNGESSKITVTVHTAGRKGEGGPFEIKFMIQDKLSEKPLVLATGVVKMSLKSSVNLAKDSNLIWRVGPGQQLQTHELTFVNNLNEPIEAVWQNDSSDAEYFRFSPEKIVIAANSQAKVSVTPTAAAGGIEYLDNIQQRISFSPVEKVRSNLKKWNETIPLSVFPDVGILAEPGAVILSSKDVLGGKVKRQIRIVRILGSEAKIGHVSASSANITIDKVGDQLLYDLSIQNAKEGFMDEVKISYQINGKDAVLVVPVYILH